MAHELPPLPYDYSALEPVIDQQTMKLHHDMHHAAYVKNLNAALEKHPNLQSKTVEQLIKDLNSIPEDIRGYGHVKARHLLAARGKWQGLMQQWRGGASAQRRAA